MGGRPVVAKYLFRWPVSVNVMGGRPVVAKYLFRWPVCVNVMGGRPVVAKYLFRWPVLSPGIASRTHQARERGDQDLLEEGRESLLTTFWFEWLRGCREFAFLAARARNDSASG